MLKKILLIGLLLLAGMLLYHWLRPPAPLAVILAAVERGVVESSVSNTRAGTVKACRRSKLSMPAGGVVDRLLVKEGETVVAGQLLLELWNQDRQADLEQAKQQLRVQQSSREQICLEAAYYQREAERQQSLLVRQLTSEEAVDNALTQANSRELACRSAQAQLDVVRARLQLQQALLDKTRLYAPFAGVIAEINGEQGEYVTPSPPGVATPPAVDLIDYSCLYVTAPIDEVDASRLQVGDRARVSLDAFQGQTFAAEVVRIAPYVVDLEKQARTVDVDVRLQELPAAVRLLVGYSADITVIEQQREQALRIPSEALFAQNKVWVVEPASGLLGQRELRLGLTNWTYTEVLAGLSEGESVVRNPDLPGLHIGGAARGGDY